MNLRSISIVILLCQMQANSFSAEFLLVRFRTIFEFRKRTLRRLFTSTIKREIRHFPVVVVQLRRRNVQKKRDTPAEFFFCLFNQLLFDVLVVVFLVASQRPLYFPQGKQTNFALNLFLEIPLYKLALYSLASWQLPRGKDSS